MRRLIIAAAITVVLSACAITPAKRETAAPVAATTPTAAVADDAARAELFRIADEYVDGLLAVNPTAGYYVEVGLTQHDYLPRNDAATRQAWQAKEDAWHARLDALPASAFATREAQIVAAQLREMLDASIQLRVCRQHNWNVNHMGGWHLSLVDLAERQPMATEFDRLAALTRWFEFGKYVDNEIANLREGVAAGYTVPKPVVDRVLKQLDGAIVDDPKQSPFFAPGKNAKDDSFAGTFAGIVANTIQPALVRYRDYLRDEYRPKARDTLAVSALPNGAACYRALLRDQSTLDRDPAAVFELGKRTVAANEQKVRELGQRYFGTDDVATIIKRVDAAPDNRYASADEMVEHARSMLDRAHERSSRYFVSLPAQPAVVEPFPEHQRGSGYSSHYEPTPDAAKPGIYRINLDHPDQARRGDGEITLVHETWPGHHLQIASARDVKTGSRLSQLAFNGAYVEGWGRYSEALAEEAGIYATKYAEISRRIWPARGLVADPGLNAFGWTRQQAVDYVTATGRFAGETAEALVDRMAAIPGQLTAYDSGALEIMGLRHEAEAALGDRFDIKAFHAQVLGDGMVPLPLLRERVTAWIASQRAAP